MKTPFRNRPKLNGHNVSICVAVGAGLTFSGVASAQTPTDDYFQAIKRAVPQLVGNVLDNDGGESNAISYHTVTPYAAVNLDLDGDMIYTPYNSDICLAETDTFGYFVPSRQDNVIVNITLLPPVAPDSYSVEAGQQLADDVQVNDPVPVSAYGNVFDQLNVSAFSPASSGTVEQSEPGVTNNTGLFTYVPDAGFSGNDIFSYYTVEPDLGCGWNTVVEVLVTPVANQDNLVTQGGAELCGIDVLDNDLGSGLEVINVVQPAGGSVTISADDTLCFQPDQGFLGTASFAYTIEDSSGSRTNGSVEIDVTNQPPVAVTDDFEVLADESLYGNLIGNDSDPNGDELEVTANTQPASGVVSVDTNGDFIYTPNAGFSGNDSFEYTLSDTSAAQAIGLVNILVRPIAPDQTFMGAEGQTVEGNLLESSVGSGLVIVSNTQPQFGTLQVGPNGDFQFTAGLGESGTGSFQYTIRDDDGSETTGMVTFQIGAAPVAIPTLGGGTLGFMALLLGWLGWRRIR